MTKKLLLLPIAFLRLHAFACGGYGDIFPRWSLNVIAVGNYQLPYSAWNPSFLPGVQLNRTMGKNTLRFGLEHVRIQHEPTSEQGADILYVSGTEQRTVLRAGFERRWYLHRLIQPYAAVDVAGQSMTSNMLYVGGIAGLDERYEITTKGIGIIPAIGFKTSIGRNVALFAEYRVEAFVNDVYRKATFYNGNIDSRPTRNTEFDFAMGTIGHLGLQIAF